MMEPEPTSTQVRHLQNQLESLLEQKEHRSALKEGAKSWSWEKAKERLREKRRAFDHQVVEVFKASPIPTPEDIYSQFDEVWISQVKDDISTLSLWKKKKEETTSIFSLLSFSVKYVINIKKANDRWKAYCEECIQIAKEEAESYPTSRE